jgi:NADH-quinone oxidoreductase subunit F
MSRNIRSLSSRKGLKNNLFEQLNEAAKLDGSPSDEALNKLADETMLSPAITYGSSSFYDFLEPGNKGRNNWACHGTACLVSNTIAQTKDQISEQCGESLCVGYCYKGGGLLSKNGKGEFSTHHHHDGNNTQPPMPVYNFAATPILTGETSDISNLYDIVLQKHEEIGHQLELSKLRGRGGAGFPFAFKLKACAKEISDQKYIVCNADEGDPGAFSDRYLLEQHPHKVMAGMYAAAIASGADRCILYIRREYPEAIAIVHEAIDTYKKFPEHISSRIKFHIIEGAGSYVCGEETALLNSIEGLRPEVRTRPPYPAAYGLWGKPTIVSNVETFANIPWILENGGENFAAIGTKDEPANPGSTGTKLVSLDSSFTRPGLYEVDFGTSFQDLVFTMAGSFSREIKALQVGGPLGSIIPINMIESLIIDFNQFQRAGFALGHAGIIAIPEDFPLIDLLRHLFSYMAHESCGKCTPCRVGTAKGAQMLASASPDNPVDHGLMMELLDVLETGSLCALGGGLPLPVHNALQHFKTELQSHFSNWGETS